MDTYVREEEAKEALEGGYSKAESLLNDEDKLERLLQRVEKKLKIVPIIGDKLADIPVLVSLVRNYVKKQYTDIPIGTIISVVSALIYFVSPIDIIPDVVPGAGYIDDGVVLALCLEMIDSDLEEYKNWRKANGMVYDIPDFEAKVNLKKEIKRKRKKVSPSSDS